MRLVLWLAYIILRVISKRGIQLLGLALWLFHCLACLIFGLIKHGFRLFLYDWLCSYFALLINWDYW